MAGFSVLSIGDPGVATLSSFSDVIVLGDAVVASEISTLDPSVILASEYLSAL